MCLNALHALPPIRLLKHEAAKLQMPPPLLPPFVFFSSSDTTHCQEIPSSLSFSFSHNHDQCTQHNHCARKNRRADIYIYSLNAKMACVRGTTLRLRPRFNPASLEGLFKSVGHRSSVHLRNTRFRSRGAPSRTTVEMGIKGRSSMLAARTAYSWAKSRAVRKDAYWDWAWEPTIMYISKKASRM